MTNFQQKGYSRITPKVIVEDVNKSLDFYTKAFGFDILEKHEHDGVISGATLKLGDTTFMILGGEHYGDTKTPKQSGVKSGFGAYVYCPDVDAFYENALKFGAISLAEPQDAFWGDRYCQMLDINGYDWGFGTYKNNT